MNQARLMQVLIAPHVSEKALRLADRHRQFVFKVLPNANKKEVKQAVELLGKRGKVIEFSKNDRVLVESFTKKLE